MKPEQAFNSKMGVGLLFLLLRLRFSDLLTNFPSIYGRRRMTSRKPANLGRLRLAKGDMQWRLRRRLILAVMFPAVEPIIDVLL
jgi:hypothetical protein